MQTTTPQPSQKILIAASEIGPVSKSGGMSQVTEALPKELARQGNEVVTVSPWYDNIDDQKFGIKNLGKVQIPFGHSENRLEEVEVGARSEMVDGKEIRHLYIKHPSLTTRKKETTDKDGNPKTEHHLYGKEDDARRFALFTRAIPHAVGMKNLGNFTPDVVHCNDWQTGLLPAILEHSDDSLLPQSWRGDNKPATIMTLHRGEFTNPPASPEQVLDWLRLPGHLVKDKSIHLEYGGNANYTWSGACTANQWNTVSKGYYGELIENKNGQYFNYDQIKGQGRGIVNGIDTITWDPQGAHIDEKNHFSADDLSGKNRLKQELCDKYGLDSTRPTIGILARLSHEKGFDVVADSIKELVDKGYNLVIAGLPNDPEIVQRLKDESAKYPEAIFDTGWLEVEERQLLVAGADMTLVPSRSEPCGLTQLEAMRNGTVPIVNPIGGLKDTVEDGVTGFHMESLDKKGLLSALDRAKEAYNSGQLAKMQEASLRQDLSWGKSAQEYMETYHIAIQKNQAKEVLRQ